MSAILRELRRNPDMLRPHRSSAKLPAVAITTETKLTYVRRARQDSNLQPLVPKLCVRGSIEQHKSFNKCSGSKAFELLLQSMLAHSLSKFYGKLQ